MGRINFLLINPTSPLRRAGTAGNPRSARVFRFSMLPSLYVAASLPSHVQVRILDEDLEPVDFDAEADLIGISSERNWSRGRMSGWNPCTCPGCRIRVMLTSSMARR